MNPSRTVFTPSSGSFSAEMRVRRSTFSGRNRSTPTGRTRGLVVSLESRHAGADNQRLSCAGDFPVVLRIASGCPLIDPKVIDWVVRAFLEKEPDYESNTLIRTYPLGLDTEVVSRLALDRAWHVASDRSFGFLMERKGGRPRLRFLKYARGQSPRTSGCT